MKGGEISKCIKPEKSNAEEMFIGMWNSRCRVRHTSVRDENLKLYPVLSLYLMTDRYIPQFTDRISAESSGGYSLRNFGVADLLHT